MWRWTLKEMPRLEGQKDFVVYFVSVLSDFSSIKTRKCKTDSIIINKFFMNVKTKIAFSPNNLQHFIYLVLYVSENF